MKILFNFGEAYYVIPDYTPCSRRWQRPARIAHRNRERLLEREQQAQQQQQAQQHEQHEQQTEQHQQAQQEEEEEDQLPDEY
ncbi:hypothetical protein K492DRAFT_197334 [Lichtheimia hyalospora FSU 10163]|nr:hypothetical protein K492DRAFT_197334 [Lichtheimia hyalospora FSU 10163]